MFYDYHMHSNFSNDSKADMEDMIKRSIDLGLKEICFTDHVDYDLDSDDSFGIDYNKYFDKIQSLQNKYKDNISIKKGIEIGLQKQIIDKCNNCLLYTSDAADERSSVDLGGSRIIKKQHIMIQAIGERYQKTKKQVMNKKQ